MSRSDYLEGAVKGEKTDWSPTAKLIFAFIIGLLLLSPAILGIFWEVLLPK
jgi:hypothetical protein